MIKEMVDFSYDETLNILGGPRIEDNNESDHLTLEQLNIERDFVIKVEENWRHRRLDIGVFDESHSESHGREILKRGLIYEVCS
jgi:hypothetical protein